MEEREETEKSLSGSTGTSQGMAGWDGRRKYRRVRMTSRCPAQVTVLLLIVRENPEEAGV